MYKYIYICIYNKYIGRGTEREMFIYSPIFGWQSNRKLKSKIQSRTDKKISVIFALGHVQRKQNRKRKKRNRTKTKYIFVLRERRGSRRKNG